MTSIRALVVPRHGDASVLTVEDRELAPPGAGEVQVAVAAAGVNFIDIYQREGVYPVPTPFVLGMEGAGTVTAVGPDVQGMTGGDRVAWAFALGSAATAANVSAAAVAPVPDGIGLDTAAAAMLQGMTAHYLTRSTYAVREGDTVLVHAAAGGVGQLLVQMCTRLGARVIATAGSSAKLDIARRLGADELVDYSAVTDVAGEVRRLTDGRGVEV
ncbi:MAG TPA: zinc-binding dehydrogenase, partial [Candidatus Lustribacter sp.]|nr:zinc-binding dehydrogenase [Candidatus Lustribacter sp.]